MGHKGWPANGALRCLARVALAFAVSLGASIARAQTLELTGGASSLLMLGPLSGEMSTAIDANVSGSISAMFRWTGGVRLGMGAWSSEAFGRISGTLDVGIFSPAAGLELGVSARGDDDSGSKLLSEGRAASREDLFPGYIALHSSPLRFQVFERFRLSVLELQLGTHLAPFGRFVRLNVQLVSLGVVL